MRRWNGWGSESVAYEVSDSAKAFLEAKIGPGKPSLDIPISQYEYLVPPSRLPSHPLLDISAKNRIQHCSGQSLADWIGIRTGTTPALPDGVFYPTAEEDIVEILRFAHEANAIIIPYGGGTSVVGHLASPKTARPVIVVDLKKMNRLIHLDEMAQIATFEAGIRGPDLEAALLAHGYTLGHYPQSFEYSTLGGWIATRSAGQFALHYGRMERLFAGGRMVTPCGTIEIPTFPASAAGPDLREWVMGSEGRFGIITRAAVRISPIPQVERFQAAFFNDFEQGAACVQQMIRSRLPLAMARLSDLSETNTTLQLNRNQRAIEWLRRWLKWHHIELNGSCMLLYGALGNKGRVGQTLREAKRCICSFAGVPVGERPGRAWYKERFRFPYLRNTLWEKGYAVDTLETATTWGKVMETKQAVEAALEHGLESFGERVHVFTHLSHVYSTGSSIYTSYVFRLANSPEESLRRFEHLKTAASKAIVQCGGTISHQHGVGLDHRPYLISEKGKLGIQAIQAVCGTFDPDGLMNTGKLLE